jgi:hypothetical protein
MANKQSESDFATLCGKNNIWCHKWRDVMYCPNCHRPIFMTQHTDQRDQSATPQSIVDYLIFTGKVAHWVECKGKGGDVRFDFADLNPKQRSFLNDWSDKGVPCWLFLTFGEGKAPNGRKAWMIPWEYYLVVESDIAKDRKSLSWVAATVELKHFELEWGERGVGWVFPHTHLMKQIYHVDLLPPLYGAV